MDEAAGAVQRLDEVEHAIGFQDLQLAPHVAEVRGAGQGRDHMAFRAKRNADRLDLVEHVALIGGRIGGDVLVDNGDFHVAPSNSERRTFNSELRSESTC